MPTTLPDIGRPYAMVSPTSVPDYKSLLDRVLGLIPSSISGRPTRPTLPGAPDLRGLLDLAVKAVPQNLPSFQDVLTQGLSSPLLQSVLGPALQNLIPGEEVARRNLMDQFRGAGALGGGAHGVASSRLESGLQGQRGNLISQIIQGLLPTIVSGYAQQSKNILDPAQMLIQSILGSMGPMANLYGTETGALTNLYGTEANLYGTESRNAFQPVSLMAQVLGLNRPELVSGATGGSTRAGAVGDRGMMTGGGGMTAAGGGMPQGPEVNDYPLSRVPYNPMNPFDFRGPPGQAESLAAFNSRAMAARNATPSPPSFDLTQYSLNQGGTNNMGGGPTGRLNIADLFSNPYTPEWGFED